MTVLRRAFVFFYLYHWCTVALVYAGGGGTAVGDVASGGGEGSGGGGDGGADFGAGFWEHLRSG